jgi:hypothetical protein
VSWIFCPSWPGLQSLYLYLPPSWYYSRDVLCLVCFLKWGLANFSPEASLKWWSSSLCLQSSCDYK